MKIEMSIKCESDDVLDDEIYEIQIDEIFDADIIWCLFTLESKDEKVK